jgi:hypothetical protein
MSFLTITQNSNTTRNLTSTTPIGPLASLYNNRYASRTHAYPRDLGSSYKGHAVGFQFVKVNPSSLNEITDTLTTALKDNAWSIAAAGATGLVTGNSTAAAAVGLAMFASGGGIDEIKNLPIVKDSINGDTTGISIQPPTEIPGDYVMLYMPETVRFDYNSDYSDLSIAEALGSSKITGQIGQAITSISEDPLVRLAMNKAGYVFNPQQQLLFNGINFRQYQMSFTFTPFSQSEALAVKNIIQLFRSYAAPTVVKSAAGFFFNPPGMVDIKYLFNGKENSNIPKVKRCVIESVEVDYAPNGWAAMKDGMPTQTTMTIGFKEVELVDKTDIVKGY